MGATGTILWPVIETSVISENVSQTLHTSASLTPTHNAYTTVAYLGWYIPSSYSMRSGITSSHSMKSGIIALVLTQLARLYEWNRDCQSIHQWAWLSEFVGGISVWSIHSFINVLWSLTPMLRNHAVELAISVTAHFVIVFCFQMLDRTIVATTNCKRFSPTKDGQAPVVITSLGFAAKNAVKLVLLVLLVLFFNHLLHFSSQTF